MRPEASSAATTRAFDGDREIFFTDLVRDGDIVEVFGSLELARTERGSWRKMRVYRDGEAWRLRLHVPSDEEFAHRTYARRLGAGEWT